MADWHNLEQQNEGNNKNDDNITTTTTTTSKRNEEKPFVYRSRRSPIICCNGCVSSSQTLASSVGLRVLRDLGGNAADAAIAMAAVLAVTEPCSTGLGGDMFALWYNSSTKQVEAINGSGRSPSNLTAEITTSHTSIDDVNFKISPHMVTIPGAAKGWEDTYNKWGSGKLTFLELLQPAIQYATEGYPVAPVTAYHWTAGHACVKHWYDKQQLESSDVKIPFTIEETKLPPKAGEIFQNPDLAIVLKELGEKGAFEGFYNGFPGQKIVETLQNLGSVITKEDLINHKSTFPNPICVEYHNKVKLWQIPPNGQGIAGLIALKGLEAISDDVIDLSTCTEADRYHAMIEMMRLGFADARKYVCDPDSNVTKEGEEGSIEWMLNSERIQTRATKLFNKEEATIHGYADPTSGTVSFQVVDSQGNAISFVNSNFMGFGTGIVPPKCGFSLQNRGYGFNYTDSTHPNYVAGNKRPYHTIIPGMLTHSKSDELYATLSNMGGYMQPQGHLQLTINLVDRKLDPQTCVDEPRFCIADGTHNGTVFFEPGVSTETESTLLRKGHNIRLNANGELRGIFGKAQIIKRNQTTGVLWAGSDGRSDGCAMGF